MGGFDLVIVRAEAPVLATVKLNTDDALTLSFPKSSCSGTMLRAAGSPAAQFNLGVMYERGLGVGQNLTQAVTWYRRAVEQNYPPAQYNLGLLYSDGRGVSRRAPVIPRPPE